MLLQEYKNPCSLINYAYSFTCVHSFGPYFTNIPYLITSLPFTPHVKQKLPSMLKQSTVLTTNNLPDRKRISRIRYSAVFGTLSLPQELLLPRRQLLFITGTKTGYTHWSETVLNLDERYFI